MDFASEMEAAAGESGPARHQRLARMLIEVAIERPDEIHGQRADN